MCNYYTILDKILITMKINFCLTLKTETITKELLLHLVDNYSAS